MGRMHSRGKGISASALPYKRTPPSWLKICSQNVEESIYKFAKKAVRLANLPAVRLLLPRVAHYHRSMSPFILSGHATILIAAFVLIKAHHMMPPPPPPNADGNQEMVDQWIRIMVTSYEILAGLGLLLNQLKNNTIF